MRKTFIGLLMAATAVTPAGVAFAQDRGDRDRDRIVAERAERGPAARQARQAAQDLAVPRGQRAAPQAQAAVQRAAPQRRAAVQRAAPQRQAAVQRATQQRQAAVRTAPQRIVRQAAQRSAPPRQIAQQRVQRQTQARVQQRQLQQRQVQQQQRQVQQQRIQRQQVQQRRVQQQRIQQQRAQQRWDRNWRQSQRFDWQRHRAGNRHLFRVPVYYAPLRNHRYSRFSIGFRLGSGFLHQRYWIGDPWQYRLPPAYPGTQWVRYYNDVLLVDRYTGEVIDVIHDFFW